MSVKPIRIISLMLMFACIIYAISIFVVGSGTFSFMIWIIGAAFFGGVFFVAGKGRWHRGPKILRRACYCLVSLGIIFMTVCMGAMLSHFGDKGVGDLDYIVVLGAQMRDREPSAIFQYRLDAAYDYLLENPETICIVSGGQGVNEVVTEGDGGKVYLVARGIAPERIIAETEAMDTVANISNSLELMGEAANTEGMKIGIVTNNFHVFRGVHLAKKLTENEVYGIAAYTVPWYVPNNMVRESFGIARDIFKMNF